MGQSASLQQTDDTGDTGHGEPDHPPEHLTSPDPSDSQGTQSLHCKSVPAAGLVTGHPEHQELLKALYTGYTKDHTLPQYSGLLPRSLECHSAMFMAVRPSLLGNNIMLYDSKLPQPAAPPSPAPQLKSKLRPSNWTEEDERLSADHHSCITRSFSTEPPPLAVSAEGSLWMQSFACNDHSQMFISCNVCRHSASEMSLNEPRQLKIVRNSIEVAFGSKHSEHDIAHQKVVKQGRETPDLLIEDGPSSNWKTRLKSLGPDLSTGAQTGDSFKEIFPSAHTSEYIYSFILCPISKKNGETGRSSGPTVPCLKILQLSFPIVKICGLWIAVGFLPELYSLLPTLNDKVKHQKFSRHFAKLSTYITMELKPSSSQRNVQACIQDGILSPFITEPASAEGTEAGVISSEWTESPPLALLEFVF